MRLVQVRFTGLPGIRDIELAFAAGRSATSDGGGLHIIYGPNEAGKSTFLRALLDLWFGAAHARSRYLPETRLEAVLARGSERRTLVRRLYRNQLALRDGDIVDETVLREWLGGFDADAFRLWWAFDHERLRAGSDTLLDVKGEAGVSLFSAGGGVQHLQQVLAAMDERLADLVDTRFAKNSTKRRLNKALHDLEAADQALRGQALRPDAWRRLCAEIERLQTEMAAHHARRQALEREVRRLERARRLRPDVAELERLDEAIACLDHAPGWTLEQAEAILADIAEAERITQDMRTLEVRLERAKAVLDEARPDPAVWAEAAGIDRLNEGLEAYVQMRTREVPQLRAELAERMVDLEGRMMEIDPSASWAEVDRLFVPAAVVDRARTLAEERAAAQRDLSHERQRVEEAAREVERLTAQLAELAPAGDAEPLRALLAAVRPLGDLDEQQAKLRQELETLRRRMAERVQAQTVWQGPLEAVATLPVPLRETVERYDAEFRAIREQVRDSARRAQDLARREQELSAALSHLERDGELPTEETLAALRSDRDHLWRAIRARWLGGAMPDGVHSAALEAAAGMAPGADGASGQAAPPEALSGAAPVPRAAVPEQAMAPDELAARYEQQVQAADEAADLLRRESRRVAERAQRQAELARVREELAAVREDLERLSERDAALQAAWEQEWQASGISPRGPAEMKEWLQTVFQPLIEGWRALQDRTAELAALGQRRDELARQLCETLAHAGATAEKTEMARANGWMALVEFAQAWLAQLDDRRTQRSALRAAREAALARQLEAERRANAAEAALRRAEAAWQTVRDPYPHLPAELGLAMALLDRIVKLQADVTQWRLRSQQLRDKEERVAAYEAQVRQLALRLGEPAPEGADVERVVRAWRERLGEARQRHGRQLEIRRLIEETERALADQGVRLQAVRERLEQARINAGCDTPEQLREAAAAAKERAERMAERDALRRRITAMGDGLPLEAVLADVRSAPPAEGLEAVLAKRREELAAVDEALLAAERRLGELEEQRRQLESHTLGGPTAAQQAESAFARVDAAWNEWLRLYLARRLLQRAIEEFRDRTEARVLAEAGRALATLTRGRYTAVDVEADGTAAYLVAVAPGGARRRPEELSDGTRDQMFLALRLAFMARHLADGEPLPVVMDDAFVHFDDSRTEAALTALAELGRQTQVLYLTHHRAVAAAGERLASQGLPVSVHELPEPL